MCGKDFKVASSRYNGYVFCWGSLRWAKHTCHNIWLMCMYMRAWVSESVCPDVSGPELLHLCVDFKNNWAQLFSILSRSAYWNFHSGRSKIKVMKAWQVFQGQTSTFWMVSTSINCYKNYFLTSESSRQIYMAELMWYFHLTGILSPRSFLDSSLPRYTCHHSTSRQSILYTDFLKVPKTVIPTTVETR